MFHSTIVCFFLSIMIQNDDQIVVSKGFVVLRLSHIKYVTFLLSGMASLWPWNCFLSASNYFQDKFQAYPNLSSNYSSIMMTTSTLTSTLFNYYLSQRQINVNYLTRLKNGNFIQIFIFILMAISVSLPNSWTIFYFVFTMINVCLTSVGSCLTQVGLMALVNTQSSVYANGTVIGNAISGVMPPISMLLSIYLNDATKDRSGEALKYFLTSVLVTTLSQVCIWVMESSELKVKQPEIIQDVDVEEEVEAQNDEGELEQVDNVTFGQLWSKLKVVETTILLTFSVTLIFPVFASNVVSLSIDSKIFTPVVFLIWNIGDLAGRVLCSMPVFVIKSNSILLVYSLLRFAFIPLFLICNLPSREKYLIGDWGYMALQFVFGLTNGQLFSCAYMRIGQLLDNVNEQRAASAFTALIINISLLIGALFSFFVVVLCS